MPWKEVKPMDERMKFISRYLDGEKITDLCHEFNISRKTGYKFIKRYEDYGAGGLLDHSTRPLRLARKTANDMEKMILDMKHLYPTWGPKKLRWKLETQHPGIKFPALSTFGYILERYGLVKKHKKRFIEERVSHKILNESTDCNQIWCTDFKGEFRLQDKSYCYPLTITDHYSRYLIACEALPSTKVHPAIAIYEEIFDKFGVPGMIRSDNGVPFSARGFGGLSGLSAWWMSLGIRPERIMPGHPEQNGRHERMHRTLKESLRRPSAKHILEQQDHFEIFMQEYNTRRPHESLQMQTPSSVYKPSTNLLIEAQKHILYPLHDCIKEVTVGGMMRYRGKRIFMGKALTGLKLGLRELGEGIYHVGLGPFEIGFVDMTKQIFLVDNPLGDEREEC